MQTQQTSLSDRKGANCAACGNVRRVGAQAGRTSRHSGAKLCGHSSAARQHAVDVVAACGALIGAACWTWAYKKNAEYAHYYYLLVECNR